MSYLTTGKFREVRDRDGIIVDPFGPRGRLSVSGQGELQLDGSNVASDIGNYTFNNNNFSVAQYTFRGGIGTVEYDALDGHLFKTQNVSRMTISDSLINVHNLPIVNIDELRIGTDQTGVFGVIRTNNNRFEFYEAGAWRNLSYDRLITELYDETDTLMLSGTTGNVTVSETVDIQWTATGADASLGLDGLRINNDTATIDVNASDTAFRAFGTNMDFTIENGTGDTIIAGASLQFKDTIGATSAIMNQTDTIYEQNADNVAFSNTLFQVASPDIYFGYLSSDATPAAVSIRIPDDSTIFGALTFVADVTMDGGTVTGLPLPGGGTDAASKDYVDTLVSTEQIDPRVFVGSGVRIGIAGDDVALSFANMSLNDSPLAWVIYNRAYINVNISSDYIYAQNGAVIADLENAQLANITANVPDVLVISAGTNDVLTDPAGAVADLESFIDAVPESIDRIIIFPILPGGTAADADVLIYNNQVEQFCHTSDKCIFINIYPRIIDATNTTAYAFRTGVSKSTTLLNTTGADAAADAVLDSLRPLGELVAPKRAFAFNTWSTTNIRGNIIEPAAALQTANTGGLANGWTQTGSGTPSIVASEFIDGYNMQRITYADADATNTELTYSRTDAAIFTQGITSWNVSAVIRVMSPNGDIAIPTILVETATGATVTDSVFLGGDNVPDPADFQPIDDETFFVRTLAPLTSTASDDTVQVTITVPVGTVSGEDTYIEIGLLSVTAA